MRVQRQAGESEHRAGPVSRFWTHLDDSDTRPSPLTHSLAEELAPHPGTPKANWRLTSLLGPRLRHLLPGRLQELKLLVSETRCKARETSAKLSSLLEPRFPHLRMGAMTSKSSRGQR